jgi:hypothetical protein
LGDVLIASSSALGSVPVVFVTLVATLILLCLRTWLGVTGVGVVRRVSILLTGSTIVFLALFLIVVFIRFKSLS